MTEVHSSYADRLRELEMFSLEKAQVSQTLHQCPKEAHKKDKTSLFSPIPCHRKRGNGHKLKHRFSVNISGFTVRATEHQHRLHRQVVESLSLEILNSCLDMVLGSLL